MNWVVGEGDPDVGTRRRKIGFEPLPDFFMASWNKKAKF